MEQERSELEAPTGGRSLVVARILGAVTVVSLAIGVVFTILDAAIRPPGSADPFGDLAFVVAFAAFPVIGYVLATRRPENAIGWLMLGMGVFFGLSASIPIGLVAPFTGDSSSFPGPTRITR